MARPKLEPTLDWIYPVCDSMMQPDSNPIAIQIYLSTRRHVQVLLIAGVIVMKKKRLDRARAGNVARDEEMMKQAPLGRHATGVC